MNKLPGAAETQRGAVLILVLWILILLTLLVSAFSRNLHVERRIAGSMVEQVRLRAAAESVLHYLTGMQAQLPGLLQELEGRALSLQIGDQQIFYQLIPEEAYVSLNASPRGLLESVIARIAPADVDVAAQVSLLLDWRDGDDVEEPDGAEQATYEAAGLDYGPKNGPITSLDELRRIPGFDRGLAEQLEPLVSVLSQSVGVDPRFAPQPVLQALADQDPEILERLAEIRSDPETAGSLAMENPYVVFDRSGNYRVRVLAGHGDAVAVAPVIEVTVNLGYPGVNHPYTVLSWNEFAGRGMAAFNQVVRK